MRASGLVANELTLHLVILWVSPLLVKYKMEVLGRVKGILKSWAGYLSHHVCTGVLAASHDLISIHILAYQ